MNPDIQYLPIAYCTQRRAKDLGGEETVFQRATHEWGERALVLIWSNDTVPPGMRIVGRVAAHRTGPAYRVALPVTNEHWCPCGDGRNRAPCPVCQETIGTQYPTAGQAL